MYEEHLKYAKDYFSIHGDVPPNPLMAFRSKYQHTIRVLGWAKRLAEGRKDVDINALYTAVVFHDIGYSEGKEFHAERGAKIFCEYGIKMAMELAFIKKVKELITLHSSKELFIVMGNNKRLLNPMVTEKAKYYWNEKQKLVEIFTKQLKNDINIS